MRKMSGSLQNNDDNLWKLFSTATLGDRLRWLREAKNLNQLEIGTECGITRQAWNNYEKRGQRMSLDEARKLHLRYGVTYDYIYAGDIRLMPTELAAQIVAIAVKERTSKGGPGSDGGKPVVIDGNKRLLARRRDVDFRRAAVHP